MALHHPYIKINTEEAFEESKKHRGAGYISLHADCSISLELQATCEGIRGTYLYFKAQDKIHYLDTKIYTVIILL